MQYFLSKTITLERLTDKNSYISEHSFTGTVTGYPASLQEPTPEQQQLFSGHIGNLYNCFVEFDCPAQEGDKVVIGDDKYSVLDIKEADFGFMSYKRLIIAKNIK